MLAQATNRSGMERARAALMTELIADPAPGSQPLQPASPMASRPWASGPQLWEPDWPVTSLRRSGCEERGGDDGDAIAAAVGVGAGGDDGGVEQAGADGAAEPVQMADVVV